MLPLVTVGALIVFAYRGYLRLTNRFGALQQLYDFSKSVSGPYLETTGTAWAILEQVQSVMRSNRAELIIVDEWPAVRHIALNGDIRSTVARTIVDSSSVIARAINNHQTSLRLGTIGGHKRELDVDSLLGEFRGAVIVPLASGERTLGALVALDRDEGFDPFDADDLRLFEALAAHASATMERAQLIEELRLEAESKWHQATHDLLTGLPNRTSVPRSGGERARQTRAEWRRPARPRSFQGGQRHPWPRHRRPAAVRGRRVPRPCEQWPGDCCPARGRRVRARRAGHDSGPKRPSASCVICSRRSPSR